MSWEFKCQTCPEWSTPNKDGGIRYCRVCAGRMMTRGRKINRVRDDGQRKHIHKDPSAMLYRDK